MSQIQPVKFDITLDDVDMSLFKMANENLTRARETLDVHVKIVQEKQVIVEKFLNKLCVLNQIDMTDYKTYSILLDEKTGKLTVDPK